ncbi:MAG: Lipid biosynthesis acyltransferase [Pedosphaera sp.]|nr:Lipid biosynthesis acyltransferase [Pedosphaera sp.]
MQDAERPTNLIHAWHLERTTPASRLKKRPRLERLGKASLDAMATAVEAAFFFGLGHIPENLSYAVAPSVGAAQRAGAGRRSIANMQLFLGPDGREPEDWQSLWAQHKRHVGITAIESIHFGSMSRDRLLAQVALEGEEHLANALKIGRGVMLFINHLGNIGAIPAALGPRGYDISITGNAMPRPYLEKKVNELYQHGGVKRVLIGEQLPFKAARVFRRNGVFAAFIDYTVVGRLNHWLPFGRAELNTNIGPALMAQRSRAPILYASCRRLPGFGHCLTLHPPLGCPLTGDRTLDALAATQMAITRLAQEILERPDQWWPWDCAQLRPRPAQRTDGPAPSRPTGDRPPTSGAR